MRAVGRRGDNGKATLQRPCQHNLSGRCLQALRNGLYHRVLQHFAVTQRHIRGNGNIMFACERNHFFVLQVGMQFDLIGRNPVAAHGIDGFTHQRNGEIGYADLAGQALLLCLCQCAHEFSDRYGVAR